MSDSKDDITLTDVISIQADCKRSVYCCKEIRIWLNTITNWISVYLWHEESMSRKCRTSIHRMHSLWACKEWYHHSICVSRKIAQKSLAYTKFVCDVCSCWSNTTLAFKGHYTRVQPYVLCSRVRNCFLDSKVQYPTLTDRYSDVRQRPTNLWILRNSAYRVKHIFVDWPDLQDSSLKYFTVSSLKNLNVSTVATSLILSVKCNAWRWADI